MAPDHIGEWVRRLGIGIEPTMSHLIESRVADRYITKCGRKMADTIKSAPKSTLKFGSSFSPCYNCSL